MTDEGASQDGAGRRRVRRALGRRVRALSGQPDLSPGPPLDQPEAPALTGEERLLLGSPLFDHDWYALVARKRLERLDAVRHFLDVGAGEGLHPHPLFDPAHFTEALEGDVWDRNPLVVYLRRRLFRTATHPLFTTAGYLARNPEARTHDWGPIGHYLETGASQRLLASRWLPVDEDGGQDDLCAWIRDRAQEWEQRRRSLPRVWNETAPSARIERFAASLAQAPEPAVEPGRPLVTVIVTSGFDAEHLAASLRGLAAQTLTGWEAVVLHEPRLAGLDAVVAAELGDSGYVLAEHTEDGAAGAVGRAIGSATGRYVAFLDAGDEWAPDRLRVLVTAAESNEWPVVADILEGVPARGGSRFASGGQSRGPVRSRAAVELSRLLVRRQSLHEVLGAGGFGDDRPGAWRLRVVVGLLEHHDVQAAAYVGTRRVFRARSEAQRRPPRQRALPDHESVESWADVVLNDTLIDWDSLGSRTPTPGLVSVIIPTYQDWAMTLVAVRRVLASASDPEQPRVECLVYDNGSDVHTSVMLDAVAARHPEATLTHSPVNHGFALGNNLAFAGARGETVVFLNNDTAVPVDWLLPVQRALADDRVLGVQPLLLFPGGAVQSAGVAFPATGGLPHSFLANFPIEDAAGVEELEFSAITGAAMVLRYDDVVALRGFDPLFTNGMEDIDLCHRLSASRAGHYRVVGEAPVIHHESRTAGRYAKHLLNRELYLGRWAGVAEPRDDVRLWASVGMQVLDHQLRETDRRTRRLVIPDPVLVRESRLRVHERPRPLRWAIKNPAPWGPEGEKWGDTHFARAVASALRDRGHEVVIDHREEFERPTSRHDDVALVLRGLTAFRPTPEQVSIGWVISHPDLVGRREALSYDRLLGASLRWSRDAADRWGIEVEPMLQATDPALFHPDLARPDTGHPVLFVGSSRKVYRPVVRDAVAAGLPLSVYGDHWREFIPDRFVKGIYLPNTEVGAAYRSAGVVLNDHWEDMRLEGFISNRLFDAVGSGARVVSDEVEGMASIFGDSVQVWHTPEDLVRLTSSYDPDAIYGDDEQRRARAERIHHEHSFGARAERLIEIARELRHTRGFED